MTSNGFRRGKEMFVELGWKDALIMVGLCRLKFYSIFWENMRIG